MPRHTKGSSVGVSSRSLMKFSFQTVAPCAMNSVSLDWSETSVEVRRAARAVVLDRVDAYPSIRDRHVRAPHPKVSTGALQFPVMTLRGSLVLPEFEILSALDFDADIPCICRKFCDEADHSADWW